MIFFANDGFYTTEIHGDDIPEGAVEISVEDYVALLEGQAAGRIISTDPAGYPLLVERPAPTREQLRATMRCSAYQIRQALSQLGLRNAVEAAVAAGGQDLMDAWQFAQIFERLHPRIIDIGIALHQTDEQMDELFELAMTLRP